MYLKTNKNKYDIIIATNFSKRLMGLMGKTNIDYGMLFPKCNSIHTYFMKENIDIIGLDENNEVIYKYENLDKNRIIKINYDIKKTSILELPANSSKKIKIGTILIFNED
ncbi:MAG: DUF192 domain-containing protein [Bacilli bacterium]|jgi:uncharacterized membrane protein (UPF0127 family)|nr:DUF192 domain-containing protein [Bacilli bacterium]